MELVQDVSTKQKIVAKLDALFSMKTEVMEDIKSHNVQLDSELQVWWALHPMMMRK